MNQKEKPFSFKSIDEIYNFVEVESKKKQKPKNLIRPENISVVKDDDSEIVLLMSYKKGNQPIPLSSQSPRILDKTREKSTSSNRQRLASTIKYLTKGIVSGDSDANSDGLGQNIRGIFNNAQNPCFKPPPMNIDEIRSTDTLNPHQIRKMTEISKYPNSYDDKVLKPLTTKSQFWDSRHKTKIPQPERLKFRDKKPSTLLPSSPGKPQTPSKIPVKQRYFALCIPDMVNNSTTAFDTESQFQTLRYFNPNAEIFKKPNNNELVVVPVNVVTKEGTDESSIGSDTYSSNEHSPGDKIELTLEELHAVVKLVKSRNM